MLERLECVFAVIVYVFALSCLVVDESNEERSVIPDRVAGVSRCISSNQRQPTSITLGGLCQSAI
jgi:hypothetical protein